VDIFPARRVLTASIEAAAARREAWLGQGEGEEAAPDQLGKE
jgi:hypothetical protein